jgi:hypothetical protein
MCLFRVTFDLKFGFIQGHAFSFFENKLIFFDKRLVNTEGACSRVKISKQT